MSPLLAGLEAAQRTTTALGGLVQSQCTVWDKTSPSQPLTAATTSPLQALCQISSLMLFTLIMDNYKVYKKK